MLDAFKTLLGDLKAIKDGHDPHEDRREIARQLATKRIRNSSLSCNSCTKLAHPILDSGDKYRCIGCGRQFAGSRHDLRPGLYADLVSAGVVMAGGNTTTRLPIVESAYDRAISNLKKDS